MYGLHLTFQSYGSQVNDLPTKVIDWFLYDENTRFMKLFVWEVLIRFAKG